MTPRKLSSLPPSVRRAVEKQLQKDATIPAREFRRSKYRAQRTEGPLPGGAGVRLYDSKKEAAYAAHLEAWRKHQWIIGWIPQVRFPLPPKPGEKRGEYVADFLVFEYTESGVGVRVVDVKGMKTREYMRKKRVFREIYGMEIEER